MGRLEKRLVYLFTGEWMSAGVFAVLYFYFSSEFALSGSIGLMFSVALLCLILLQGGLYWFVRWRTVRTGKPGTQVYRQLPYWKRVNQALLLIGGVVLLLEIILAAPVLPVILAIMFVYGFAVIEYINYFHVQLTNYRGGRFRRSSIAKEIERQLQS
ncbi:hypothetical protein CR205_03150 [Alteribacter lacisalsi]|uniref:Uncharacterized protein n=2 Tax=Alteribacter lacisalsi TaxID=2045244 RepID=A0A2W0H9Z8_9BACI|nr:hypothetical protein CR205_03150 [Alteribacter lacisalsi]